MWPHAWTLETPPHHHTPSTPHHAGPSAAHHTPTTHHTTPTALCHSHALLIFTKTTKFLFTLFLFIPEIFRRNSGLEPVTRSVLCPFMCILTQRFPGKYFNFQIQKFLTSLSASINLKFMRKWQIKNCRSKKMEQNPGNL